MVKSFVFGKGCTTHAVPSGPKNLVRMPRSTRFFAPLEPAKATFHNETTLRAPGFPADPPSLHTPLPKGEGSYCYNPLSQSEIAVGAHYLRFLQT